MGQIGVVAIVSDGKEYWTEVFRGSDVEGTFTRHINPRRWPSPAAAQQGSPWWPAGATGTAPGSDAERMHRALCSWADCDHHVLSLAGLPSRDGGTAA